MSELIRITIRRSTGEEVRREVRSAESTTAPRRHWLDAVADILYPRAVRDGVIPAVGPATATDRERERAG